jgi:hypothetical protein
MATLKIEKSMPSMKHSLPHLFLHIKALIVETIARTYQATLSGG